MNRIRNILKGYSFARNWLQMKTPLLIRFINKPFYEQWIFIEAFLILLLTRFVISFLPFKVLRYMIGSSQSIHNEVQSMAPMPFESTDGASCDNSNNTIGKQLITQAIARSVYCVSQKIPWQSDCLVQAASGKIMLNRRKLQNTLCLGVQKKLSRNGNMKPHAWLVSNSVVILGGGELEKYVVVSEFS